MSSAEQEYRPAAPAENAGDYFVLSVPGDYWVVSAEMARSIDAALARRVPPRWVVFVDLAGARVRLRTDRIESLTQSTAEQRAFRREFGRRVEREFPPDPGPESEGEPEWDT